MNIIRQKFVNPLLILAITAGFLMSCGGDKKEEEKEEIVESTDTVKTAVLNVNGELFSVPSPVQTALLVQKSGISYDKSVLSPANKVNIFSTDYSRAFNLGIYGADLGYVSLYNQTQDALGYLAAVKQLSDKLGLSAAFDVPTMERIKNNITNKDSMMTLVGLAYRASDSYLKNNKRNDISTVILAGGWVESMYFSIVAFKAKPSDAIRERIAQQKQALNSLIKILSSNPSPEVTEISTMLGDLSKVYEGIEFKYVYAEPTTDADKKITTINSITQVKVSDEQLAQIMSKVLDIRNKLINTTKS
jgi:hypothetical protein